MSQLQSGGQLEGKEVKPILYGTHMHWIDMPPCKICQRENEVWDRTLANMGSHNLAVRITKRESYRLYDRKWPFDMTSKAVPLESVQDTLGYEDEVLAMIEGDEARESFLTRLTPYQRELAEKFEQGYRPRDIAEMKGKENSGSIRWQKHNIKQKAQEYWGEQDG